MGRAEAAKEETVDDDVAGVQDLVGLMGLININKY